MSKLLISTHNDDEALFASFTIQRELPQVAIVYDSFVQVKRGYSSCRAEVRRSESQRALRELGVADIIFLGFSDERDDIEHLVVDAFRHRFAKITEVWAPAEEVGGHKQHNLVARAAQSVFGNRIRDRYLSYVRGQGKSRSDRPVESRPEWILLKLKALACYETQITIPELGCWPHFAEDLKEYYA